VLNWNTPHLKQRMTWIGGLKDGTPCGNGSTLAATQHIRAVLPDVALRYGIESVCDAGAGDLHWMQFVQWDVQYRAFDFVPRHSDVIALDITREALPQCDLILCRHVLIHLDPERIIDALKLFKSSGRYLLASQYDHAKPFDPCRQFNRTDLRGYLGDPIERHQDSDSDLALWLL
jgi:hypothetical protein